jgi:hypothetical protein
MVCIQYGTAVTYIRVFRLLTALIIRGLDRLFHLHQGQELVDITILHLLHVEAKIFGVNLEITDSSALLAVDLVRFSWGWFAGKN